MTELDNIFKTLKKRLRAQGTTYRDIAGQMGVSESAIKRRFASRRVSAEDLVAIANLLGFTLAKLAQEAALSEKRLHTLTPAQERELVADTKLLLVTVCVLNQWSQDDICARYALTQAECVQRLARLDRLGLIHLLPGNRIRHNVARDFDWIPDGPIRRFFHDQGLADFLRSAFTKNDEAMAFCHGMLTEAAIARLQGEIQKLRQRLAELHEESLAAPLAKRRGCGLLLAAREWELAAFTQLKR